MGRLFEEGEYFVPEMLIAACAMQASVAILKPKLLEAAGFEIIDLGTDVPPEKFVAAIKDNDAGFVGMSALLTTTMPAMKTSIDALKEAGVRDNVNVLIGGAPVTQNYAGNIGADIYAPDGPSAARKAKEALV